MAHTMNYLVTKSQTASGYVGKFAKTFGDKFGQLKKATKDAYIRALWKQKKELPPENVGFTSLEKKAAQTVISKYRHPLHAYHTTIQGFAKNLLRQNVWRNGLMGRRGHFGGVYIWRRMRYGHLIGFSTLFLVREENHIEEMNFKKRWQAYNILCQNIKDTMRCQKFDEPHSEGIPDTIGHSLSDFKIGKSIAIGCNGAVYETEVKSTSDGVKEDLGKEKKLAGNKRTKGKKRLKKRTLKSVPKLAVKIIYNFDSSNCGSIERMTRSELITCGRGALSILSKDWQNGSRARMKRLPPHPNIIQVIRALVAKIPEHPEFVEKHPASLSSPHGYGKSTTMFLVMKRYDGTLEDYLKGSRVGILQRQMLCLQLLQGIAHLESNKVAHRDLKPNNILIGKDSVNLPRLVISDFGCSLFSENDEDLVFPFPTWNHDIRLGNNKFQPPEITQCVPGPISYLDYRKSDAWAAGLLMREIMGFHHYESSPNETTSLIEKLSELLTKKDVKERISCMFAMKVLHLQMFGPKMKNQRDWEKRLGDWWLLMHACETLAYKTTEWGKNSTACDIFCNFLSSLDSAELYAAFNNWQSLLFA